MSRKYKLVGGWWVRNSEQSLWLKIGAGAWVEAPLDPFLDLSAAGGYAFPDDTGSGDDLIYVLNNTLQACTSGYPGVSASFPYCVYDPDDGTVGIRWQDTDGLGALQLRFDHPTLPNANKNSYFLHDFWRMTAVRTALIVVPSGLPGIVNGARVHGFGLYPQRAMMRDLSEWEARVTQAVPDNGTPQTLRSAMLERYRLGIRVDKAYPRQAFFSEYDQLVDFMNHAASGRPFRVYPDRTEVGAHEVVTKPWGWRAWVLDKDSASWRPEPPFNNWYKTFDVELSAWPYLGG